MWRTRSLESGQNMMLKIFFAFIEFYGEIHGSFSLFFFQLQRLAVAALAAMCCDE
jgi:hypothetical protein